MAYKSAISLITSMSALERHPTNSHFWRACASASEHRGAQIAIEPECVLLY